MAHTTQCGTVTPVSIKHQLEQVEDETAAAATMTVSERVDALPITQLLILEVLGARSRLGEALWTFPSRCRPALRALESAGLAEWKGGVVDNTVRAWLTDLGRAGVLSSTYTPPVMADVTAYTFLPSGCDPEDDRRDPYSFAVRAEYRGGGTWAVVHNARTLSTAGKLDFDPGADGRTSKYLATHRFDRDTAVVKARSLADTLTVNGKTWAQWQGWPANAPDRG